MMNPYIVHRLSYLLQSADYRVVLPLLARMPIFLGENLSLLRGALQTCIDYDWRSIAIGRRYIRSRVYQAMKLLLPQGGKKRWVQATFGRFIHNSRTEWQDSLFGCKDLTSFGRRSSIEGLDLLLNVQRQGRGLVLATCHFDSFIMGMALLGMHGLKVNVFTSAVVEDPRVHPAVRDFFSRKYRLMEPYIGGSAFHFENGMDFFYRALHRGETVIILVDVPGNKSTIHTRFLGRTFKMPLGAWQMAKKTGSALGAFLCLHQGPGKYKIVCHPPRDVIEESPSKTMEPIYSFFETWIRRTPERWLAAEHLVSYGQ